MAKPASPSPPHGDKGNRHVDIRGQKEKQHVPVQNNLGAAAIGGRFARRSVSKGPQTLRGTTHQAERVATVKGYGGHTRSSTLASFDDLASGGMGTPRSPSTNTRTGQRFPHTTRLIVHRVRNVNTSAAAGQEGVRFRPGAITLLVEPSHALTYSY